jgi:retron-type reverse transcriptase
MRRYNNLWDQVISYENLIQATRQAQRGKRFRDSTLTFNFNLERELESLQTTLKNQTYQPGTYKTFNIIDPKPRLISAAPYRDRVVHHALCNIIGPIFERSFIHHSYANRKGFGTHRALKRLTYLVRHHDHILQCDIRRYFPSIDHEILKSLIRRKIKCPETLWLIELIIDHSNPQEPIYDYFPGDSLFTPYLRRRGLPIGNLTSQFFANVYLTGFDHFVQSTLNCAYIRYVDDFVLLHNDADHLATARPALESYLANLRLKIHPIKSQQFATSIGTNFVGFRVFPTHIRVRNDNLRRGRRRLNRLHTSYRAGQIPLTQIEQSIASWEAHLKYGDTHHLRQQIQQNLSYDCCKTLDKSSSLKVGSA